MGRFTRQLVVVGGLLVVTAARAWALPPVINGILGPGEWDAFFARAFDPNEPLITDNWDIREFRALREDTGGGSDGLYFLFTTFAPPTFVGGPGAGPNEAFYAIIIDADGNGLFTDPGDRQIRYNDPFLRDRLVKVFDGTGGLLGLGTGALNEVVEIYVPEALAGNLSSQSRMYGRLDNSGDEPDDRIPDLGFITPVPEPASAALLGLGMLTAAAGLTSTRRRRKRSR